MGTVTIGSSTYSVYGTHAALTDYAAGSFVHAATYAAATTANQQRALVEATRILLSLTWVDAANANVDTASATAIQAAQELALAGLADAAVFTAATASSNIKSAGAGKAAVEFFSPVGVGRFPVRVMDLLSGLVEGIGSTLYGGAESGGTDESSDFDDGAYALTL